MDPVQRKRKALVAAKFLSAVLLLIAFVLLLKHFIMNPALIQAFLDGAQNKPGLTIPLFILANLIAPITFLPSAPFQLLAGAVWAVPLAFLISGSASLCANLAAFSFGRYFFRERLSAYMSSNVPSFPAIQAAIVTEGWRLVLMLRLSPVLPDSLMNYAMALTPITFDMFASATAVAMVPWVLLYVYLGSASKNIVATMTGKGGDDSQDGSGGTWLNVLLTVLSIGLGAVAVVYLGRVIKAAIAKAEAAALREACSDDDDVGAAAGAGLCLPGSERVPLLASTGSAAAAVGAEQPTGAVQVLGSFRQMVLGGSDGEEEEPRGVQRGRKGVALALLAPTSQTSSPHSLDKR